MKKLLLIVSPFNKIVEFHMSRFIRQKQEIANIIIRPIFINMMNYFFRMKNSSDMFFHNVPMFKNIAFFIATRMVWLKNKNISMKSSISSIFPKRMLISFFKLAGIPIMFSFVWRRLTNFKLSVTLLRAKDVLFDTCRNSYNFLFTKITRKDFFMNFTSFFTGLRTKVYDTIFQKSFTRFTSFSHCILLSFLSIIMLLAMTCQGFCIQEWDKGTPDATDNLTSWPTQSADNLSNLDRLLSNYRRGMGLTYASASSLTVGVGECTVSNTAGTVRYMRNNTSSSTLTTADLDTGSSFSAGITYYVYAIGDVSQNNAQFKISTNSTSPSGVTYYLQLGYFTTDGSGNISYISDYTNTFGSLGTWASKSFNTIYGPVSTDGFIVGTISVNNGDDIQIWTDSSSSPTTRREQFSTGSGTTAVTVGFCCPIKKGDYWKVATVSGSPGVAEVLYWIPLGN